MDILRLAADGFALTALMFLPDKKFKWHLPYIFGLFFMTFEVYFTYRGQENSDLFFWHGYLAWSIANLVVFSVRFMEKDSHIRKRLIRERLALWQIVIITVFAGFSLCAGWLMKLYIR